MNHIQTAQIIKSQCKLKSISISKLLKECEVRKSFIYDLEKRNYTPSVEVMERISNYLDCSVDYLLGRTNNPNLIINKSYLEDNMKNILNSSFGNNSTFINGSSNSTVISGNNLNIHENKGNENKKSDNSISEQQKELMRIYNSLNIKEQTELLSFAFKLEENKN